MAHWFDTTPRSYNELLEKHADPRVEDWFLMSSPLPSLAICILYVYLVEFAGPKMMEDRKPYELRNLMVVYNLGMVGLSSYIFLEFLFSGWATTYRIIGCQPVDFSWTSQAIRMASVCWLFYMSKFLELFDTIFFILRKKYNQVSFLHVFHHGIMPISWWFGVKFVPGGFGTFHALCNSFIHMVMYTYYGLSAMGPSMQKYLWWKKYMTKMQITQFLIVFVHSMQLHFIDCDYPKIFMYWIALYAFLFFFMFANFYIQAYRKSHQAKDKNVHENGKLSNGCSSEVKGSNNSDIPSEANGLMKPKQP